MHRIDTPNRSPDLFGPGKDGFRDGNKTAGTNATEFTGAWCNDMQENVAQVIEGAGFALVKGDGTQLRQAITKMVQSAQRAVIIDAATFAGAVVGTGKAVYWDAANNRFDLAVADGSVKQSMVGFADVPAAKVYCFGAAPLFAGLLPGRYYLDSVTPGAITSAMPAANAVFVGVAKGATELFVDIDALPSTVVKQLQSVTATVAGNALTLGLNPTSLDFRSSVLTNGVPNTRTVGAALSLVVPSGATLGTVSGQPARLALLAIDNAGAVELAVVNVGGGVNLDETTLISTTAISAASNAASTIYSANARVGVPFRVVEVIEITEASAGTWATAPTLVQPAGGQALTSLLLAGSRQTWQDVTALRPSGATFYNTTGQEITFLITLQGNTGTTISFSAEINGFPLVTSLTASAYNATPAYSTTIQIPPAASYKMTYSAYAVKISEKR